MIEQLPCGCYKAGMRRLLLKLALKQRWYGLFDFIHGPITLTTKGLL